MTLAQIELARHALGLPNKRRQSYRNYFVAGKGHEDYPAWLQMVEQGDARRYDGTKVHFGGDDLFTLTIAGAEKALQRGERLDPEDFPKGAFAAMSYRTHLTLGIIAGCCAILIGAGAAALIDMMFAR